jgi:2-polyprenyl-6-methoxyphenol hydroxylase-like FAD-dependent oxidoreductase
MSNHPALTRDHAVVAGASLAGLMSARVLSDHFDRVTVLDRDVWSDRRLPRRGVPHGGHAHGLLSSGRTVLEQLFPGLTDELVALGGVFGDIQNDTSWNLAGGQLACRPSDLKGVLVSRLTLESAVRERVLAIPNITLREEQGVSGLSMADGGPVALVDGVELFATHGPPAPVSRLAADFVVDATGRRSQAPAWLHRRGLDRPVQDRVGMDVQYATRWFERRPGDMDGYLATARGATPENPRGGVALAQEGDRWVVGLNGYHGRRPPLELEAFRQWARETSPLIGALVSKATPLDDGSRFGLKAAVWNRYDKAQGQPANFVVTGDAVCGFNPVYGQGMSVAAREALVLDAVLATGAPDVAQRFHRGARPVIETAWRLSTGNDLALPETTGRRTGSGQLVGRYLHRLLVAAREDPGLAYAFLRVSNLEDSPASLFAPRVAARVLARGGRAGRAMPASRPAADGSSLTELPRSA